MSSFVRVVRAVLRVRAGGPGDGPGSACGSVPQAWTDVPIFSPDTTATMLPGLSSPKKTIGSW